MKKETLTAGGNSSVEIHHHGAHLTSWKNSKGREMIYTSPTAIYNGEKAIRGGIPICFPQFAKAGPLRQHGFARNMCWQRDPTHVSQPSAPSICFTLQNTPETSASEWPYRFKASYIVTLSADGNTLTIDFQVTNADDRPFTFTTALHSYFTCSADETTLPDFDSIHYNDSIDQESTSPKQQTGLISFGKEVDRIYLAAPDTITIPSAGLTIQKSNLPEAVVWNPYIEKAAAMADLPDDGWHHFICIEPARIVDPAVVEPGATWTGQCILKSSS